MTVNLAAGWNNLWNAVKDALGNQITDIMLVVGVFLVVVSIGAWVWKRRRGGSGVQDMNGIWWTMAIGALLAAPDALLPLVLNLADGIINAVIGILQIGS